MDWLQLGAIATVGGFVVIAGSILWRLSGRLSDVESTADKGLLTAQAAKLAVEMLASDVNKHRVEIAKEYVTTKALESLENKLIEAINRLGDRLDRLFQQRP